MSHAQRLLVRRLGLQEYEETWLRMQQFTEQRTATTEDEMWIVEHPAVFTLGRNADQQHLLDTREIPVRHVDRGGQVTYHGPGQLLLYLLLDLRRLRLGVRQLVQLMEESVIELLRQQGISARRQAGAPGIYVNDAKIAAIGLRIRHGCSFHGLSLNVDMELEPFSRIHPCGFSDLPVTQLKDLGIRTSVTQVGEQLSELLAQQLGYTVCHTPDQHPKQ
jgi:lipoyl(octanoyl) transferase